MKKSWIIKELTEQLPIMPEYPALVLRLLGLRGIVKDEEVKEFLEPDYNKLFDPFLFKDMPKAVARIWAAVEKKEKIMIYADYDADAITAASVVFLALRKAGAIIDAYIPDRFTEGYGMNVEAVTKLNQDGVNLIITVDCGINAVQEAQKAKELGVDLIITDHHELTGQLPDCHAIINPKNPNDTYPFLSLTGVGVAFKLIQALFSDKAKISQYGIPEGWEKWLLDLVAIGTVADLQSLTSENRIMVSFGLKVLAKTKLPGLKALLDAAGSKPPYDAFTLGFGIAPRINAAGRIKHANVAFRMLTADNILEAQNLAIELNDLNKHRQMLTEQILSEARTQIELISDRKILLAAGSNWPKGVVGLVAGKLCEEYNKPVLVLDKGDEFATGSARSVENFDIVAALIDSKDLLVKYGGHKQAAGFTLESGKVDAFYEKLLRYADGLNVDFGQPTLKVDAELGPSDINFENYEYVEKLSPFGFGNPKPKFMSRGLELVDMNLVGNQKQHAKMRVRFGDMIFTGIAFNQGFLAQVLKPAQIFDAVYEITCNEWNGLRQLELRIIDTKIVE
jgi:single-stranded-DNA-specific exonuclease